MVRNMRIQKAANGRTALLLAGVFLLSIRTCSAQEPAPQQKPADAASPQNAEKPGAEAAGQQPLPVSQTIKKESRLVLVDTVVTDKKGNYIHDLTQNDFKVYEDNKEHPITSFATGANAAGP